MKTESHSIHDVLAKNATSFFIPPFQRAYAWGRPEVERFFNDVKRIIHSELDPNQKDKLEHFFGTIVIREEKSGFANRSVIVDGQQRLTTVLLFLIALRDTTTDQEKQNDITNTYLINNSSTFQDKIKLKQVTKDWDAYKALINKTTTISGSITNSYELLKKLINEMNKSNRNVGSEHFIIAIQRINVAVIFLDERPYKGEDPQIIFETLNSLGKPLTLSDLVRNYVLLKLESNSQINIYENTWYPRIEAVLNDDSSKFFRDYLQLKTASSLKVVNDNNTKELYQLFKEFVEKNYENHNDFINDIVKYVPLYKWIIYETNNDQISKDQNNNRTIKELLRNIFHDIGSEAFKPFVLGLLEYHQFPVNNTTLNDDELISALVIIRTYLIRRRILGLTQGENKNIVLLCKEISDIALGKTSVVELLSNMFYRLRLPNDDEIRERLISINFYEELKQYSKFILGKIEEYNSKVSVDFRDRKITIEHIMPIKLDDTWKKELGDNFQETHKNYLDNIGNLILTEFNQEMGNKSFAEKKEKLNQSNLSYRLDVIHKAAWNEQSIKEHQENMIDRFIATFPLPEEYQHKNNWKSELTEKQSFSPLDSDAGVIAEGNRPAELHILNKKIYLATWQDVFIQFLVCIKHNNESNYDFIINNQYDLFKSNNIIIKWVKLKEMIDSRIELTSRYKTLEGKTWDKVKELKDDTLFIHINISASTCISRISNIMEKLFMDADSVQIKLK